MSIFPLLAPILYAETHFRLIPGLWSRIFKKEPEIVADTVWRIEPGLTLPLFIFIKDANLFPIVLLDIEVILQGREISSKLRFSFDQKINDKSWWKIEFIDIADFAPGQWIETSVEIHYRDHKNRLKSCRNDNYYPPTPSLSTYIASNDLLKSPGWHLGDLHLHSDYTSDQIEFAAPVKATAIMAKTLGLDFLGITDHAYDLDDMEDDYLQNDPAHPKWQAFSKEIKKHNQLSEPPIILPGFEVSVENHKQKSVHLQVFNSGELYQGSSDSGEKWIHSQPEWHLSNILTRLKSKSLACAAHIGEKPPLLHKMLLGRGHYDEEDLSINDLTHFQLANGDHMKNLERGIALWRNQLLKGRKVVPIAGSDSHGNFNFSRNVVLPHWSLKIEKKQLLGEVRTAVWAPQPLTSLDDYIAALKIGQTQISNGPLIDIVKKGEHHSQIGLAAADENQRYELTARSDPEFGELDSVKVLTGTLNATEQTLKIFNIDGFQFKEDIHLEIKTKEILYFRFEAYTKSGRFSVTAPLYVPKNTPSSAE